MTRTREDSSLQIWTASYINSIADRFPEDEDLVVIQIEPSGHPGDYIVEVVKKEDE